MESVREAEVAAQLSPLDPLKYFFDVILAGSYSAVRNYDGAITLALRSLRANKDHMPALRVLLCAQGESGRSTEAVATLDQIFRLVPNFSIETYMAMGSAESPLRQRLVSVLRALKVPES